MLLGSHVQSCSNLTHNFQIYFQSDVVSLAYLRKNPVKLSGIKHLFKAHFKERNYMHVGYVWAHPKGELSLDETSK